VKTLPFLFMWFTKQTNCFYTGLIMIDIKPFLYYGINFVAFVKIHIMRQFLFYVMAILISTTSLAQTMNINGVPTVLTTKSKDIPDDLKKIQHKKYAFQDYKPCIIDNNKETAFLRYNIFDDEMEFIKDNKIYYLKKDAGRTIKFKNYTTYKVFEYNGDPTYFIVHSEGKNSLLAKQVVRFVEAKEGQTQYDVSKPSDYKRKSDVLYFDLDGVGIVEVPSRKKDFYSLFSSNSNSVKNHMKKNKLNHKKVEDLKLILNYLNSM